MELRKIFYALASPWVTAFENTISPGYFSPSQDVMAELNKAGYSFKRNWVYPGASVVTFAVKDQDGIEINFQNAPNWKQRLEKYKTDFRIAQELVSVLRVQARDLKKQKTYSAPGVKQRYN